MGLLHANQCRRTLAYDGIASVTYEILRFTQRKKQVSYFSRFGK